MARDDDQPKTPRAIPMRPPRRETPVTTPSPVMRREQGPMPPRARDVREPLVPTAQTAQAAASQALEAVSTLLTKFAELETLIRERPSGPPSSQVLDLSSTPTPTPAELLEGKPPSSGPRSIPARAAEATGNATKAVAKNKIVRGMLLAAGIFPWVSQIIGWIRGIDVGPIVSGLRIMADALESLGRGGM